MMTTALLPEKKAAEEEDDDDDDVELTEDAEPAEDCVVVDVALDVVLGPLVELVEPDELLLATLDPIDVVVEDVELDVWLDDLTVVDDVLVTDEVEEVGGPVGMTRTLPDATFAT